MHAVRIRKTAMISFNDKEKRELENMNDRSLIIITSLIIVSARIIAYFLK